MLSKLFSLSTLDLLLTIIFVPACIGLIVIVLLQKGKGTGFAGAFGIGSGSETVFGPRATQSVPIRLTYLFATLFMVIALTKSVIAGSVGKGDAPDLVEVEGSAISAGSSALDDLGLGSGQVGNAAVSEGDVQSLVSPEPVTEGELEVFVNPDGDAESTEEQ